MENRIPDDLGKPKLHGSDRPARKPAHVLTVVVAIAATCVVAGLLLAGVL